MHYDLRSYIFVAIMQQTIIINLCGYIDMYIYAPPPPVALALLHLVCSVLLYVQLQVIEWETNHYVLG